MVHQGRGVLSILLGPSSNLPTTSNDALCRFQECANRIETASLEAGRAIVQPYGLDKDQVGDATSTNRSIKINVPPPPTRVAAFEGEPFECPYCLNLIEIGSRLDWEYVGNFTGNLFIW